MTTFYGPMPQHAWQLWRVTEGVDAIPPDVAGNQIDCTGEDWFFFHLANMKNFITYRLWVYGLARYNATHWYFAPIASARYDETPNTEGMSDIVRVTSYEEVYVRVFDGTGMNLAADIMYSLARETYPRQNIP